MSFRFWRNEKNFWPFLFVVALLLIPVSIGGTYLYYTKNFVPSKSPLRWDIPKDKETDPKAWAKFFGPHYDSYKQPLAPYPQGFGGLPPVKEAKADPVLEKIYKGFIAESSTEPRSHPFSLEDIDRTDAVRKKSASCLACKSADSVRLIKEYGDDFFLKPYQEIRPLLKHPVGCSDCHDPKTLELRFTRPFLQEAMERQGKQLVNLSRKEMRNWLCAQCHSSLYLDPKTKKVTFPWDKGMKAEDQLAYFDSINYSDWTHPDTGAKLADTMHTQSDLYFAKSPHYNGGVTCADCHFPFVKEGNYKITSHWPTTNANRQLQGCQVCHRQEESYLKNSISDSQKLAKETSDTAAKALAEAIDAVKTARQTPGANQKLITEAQKLHREAFFYFSFVGTDGSKGFHNPPEALRLLSKTIDLAHRMKAKALEAL